MIMIKIMTMIMKKTMLRKRIRGYRGKGKTILFLQLWVVPSKNHPTISWVVNAYTE